jgi:hypothetical protein
MKDHRNEFKKLIEGTISAMGGRAPDEAAMGIWLLALNAFDYADVREAILNWASTETTWPRPADITKAIKGKHARAAENAEASRRVAEELERASLPDATDEVKNFLIALNYRLNSANSSQGDFVQRAKRIREARAKGWSSVDGITLLPIHDYWADRVLGVQ